MDLLWCDLSSPRAGLFHADGTVICSGSDSYSEFDLW